jgi:hypothetical protein
LKILFSFTVPITIISSNFAVLNSAKEDNALRECRFYTTIQRLVLKPQQQRVDSTELLEKERDISTRQLLKLIRQELELQAVSINELQDALDKVGRRWRVIDVASQYVFLLVFFGC